MKRQMLILFVLILVLVCEVLVHTRTLYVIADSNCVQPDYRTSCPWPADPNHEVNAVLGPVAYNSDIWQIPVGKYNRYGRWCQPYQFRVTRIELVAGSLPATISADPNGVWLLTAEVPPGRHAWDVLAEDEYGGRVVVRIACEAILPANSAPILE